MLLHCIVYHLQRKVADYLERSRLAGEEDKANLPGSRIGTKLVKKLKRLGSKVLVGGRVPGNLDGIFDLGLHDIPPAWVRTE